MNAIDALLADIEQRLDKHLPGHSMASAERVVTEMMGGNVHLAQHPLLPTFEQIEAAAEAGKEFMQRQRNLGLDFRR